jgi:hypothetical protein
MKTIWAFGDSYTFGHELSDCPTNIEKIPSNLTYAALTAKELNYNYQCKAMGYYANNAIARTIIENVNNIDKDDIVLVMWTFPIRQEFMLEQGLITISKPEDHEFAKHYIKYVDLSNHWMIKQSLRDIFLAQELLKNHQYLFLSTVTDLNKTIINREYIGGPLVEHINLDKWLVLDQQLGFHEWSELMLGRKINNHPPDPAHKLLAEIIKNVL